MLPRCIQSSAIVLTFLNFIKLCLFLCMCDSVICPVWLFIKPFNWRFHDSLILKNFLTLFFKYFSFSHFFPFSHSFWQVFWISIKASMFFLLTFFYLIHHFHLFIPDVFRRIFWHVVSVNGAFPSQKHFSIQCFHWLFYLKNYVFFS